MQNDAHEPQDSAFREQRQPEHGSLKPVLQQTYNVLVWRKRTVVGVLAATLAAGLGYLALVPAHYTATAVLLTDTKRSPELQDTGRDVPVDSSVVETQIEAIRSQILALGVVDKLALETHPDFNTERSALGTLVMSFLGLASAQDPDDHGLRRRLALATLVKKLGVRRLGRSYVAEISFTSRDPEMAARIVNAIAEGYITEQLGARQASRQLSNDWMEKKVRDLREEANRASEALQVATASTAQGGSTTDTAGQAGRPIPKLPAEMRELEARAQITKANYEAYLARYTQSLQLQTLAVPATEARLLTFANTPDKRSFPRPSQVLLLALIGGGVLGIGGAFVKESMERRVRSRSQIQRELGLRTFLCVPRVRRRIFGRGNSPLQLLAGPSEKSIRHIKVSIDECTPRDACAVIGVTSALSREGKTAIAYNVAKACASGGSRVLLIDANASRSGLTAKLQMSSEADPSQVVYDSEGGLCIAHLGLLNHLDGKAGSSHASDILSSAATADALKRIGAEFDYIVVDLPSMLETVEVTAVAEALSCIVVVTEWGRTSLDDVELALSDAGRVADRVLGIVINKAPAGSSRHVA